MWSDEGLTLEMLYVQQTSQAKNISYQPMFDQNLYSAYSQTVYSPLHPLRPSRFCGT